MARPQKATVDYFPHYVNHGRTMFTLETKFGNDGYSFWFKTLELLGSTENHFIDCDCCETWEFLLAKTRLNEVTATEMLCLLAKLGAIDSELWEKKIIWSENFISNLSTVYARRNINTYNKQDILNYCQQKLYVNGVSVNINPQSKVKESKLKDKKIPVHLKDFEKFWEAYPIKKSKDKAKEYWNKLCKRGELPEIEIILAAVQNQTAERIRKKQTKQFVPEWKHPSTWIHQKCWEDETCECADEVESRLDASGYDPVTKRYMTPDGQPRVVL